MTTVVIRLAAEPRIKVIAGHAWTACLSAALTVCGVTGLGTTCGVIYFVVNPLSHGPLWQLLLAIPFASATHQLATYIHALTARIRERT
jgi:hypothetical protein